MASKNPPITGAAQSVTNEHMRKVLKGRPEPAAPPPKERKSFGTPKRKADPEEPVEIDGVKERSAEPE